MTDPFDGAGKPFQGPSLRAALILALVIVLAIAAIWLAASWALKEADKHGINTQVNDQVQQSP